LTQVQAGSWDNRLPWLACIESTETVLLPGKQVLTQPAIRVGRTAPGGLLVIQKLSISDV
jgi:hypothetical protein